MSYGIEFNNGNNSAVLSADSIGYAYHSTQTHADRISVVGGTGNVFGTIEKYSVANCPDYPKVFIADLSTFPEYSGGTMAVSETQKMIMVTSITASSDPTNYDWDIYIIRGYDTESSVTNPIRLIFFYFNENNTTDRLWNKFI